MNAPETLFVIFVSDVFIKFFADFSAVSGAVGRRFESCRAYHLVSPIVYKAFLKNIRREFLQSVSLHLSFDAGNGVAHRDKR